MKLIIDVPKEFYETIKTTLSYRFNYLEEKVRQATPLQVEFEEIKAEINEQIDFNESCCERTDLYEAIGIINRRIAELEGE